MKMRNSILNAKECKFFFARSGKENRKKGKRKREIFGIIEKQKGSRPARARHKTYDRNRVLIVGKQWDILG